MKIIKYAVFHWNNSQGSFSLRYKYPLSTVLIKTLNSYFSLRVTPSFTPIHTTDKTMFLYIFWYCHFWKEMVHLCKMWNTGIKTWFEGLLLCEFEWWWEDRGIEVCIMKIWGSKIQGSEVRILQVVRKNKLFSSIHKMEGMK